MSGGHFSVTLENNVDWIDGERWRIRHGFRYYLTADEGGEFVDVPAGFVTNFASVPRLLWPLFPPTGKTYAQISAVHDKLFLAPVVRTPLSARPCQWSETPRIYLDGAEAAGASWVARRILYRSLQAFSRGAWDRYRAADRAASQRLALATPLELVHWEAVTVAARIDGAA